MAEYHKCILESTFEEDNLIIPQIGEMKIEIKEDFAILLLKLKTNKIFFNSHDLLFILLKES